MKLKLLQWLARALGYLPVSWAEALSRPLGWMAWKSAKTRRTSTRKNLEACYPDTSEMMRERLGRESMRHLVMTVLESGVCWSGSRKRIQRIFLKPDGMELIPELLAERRGLLALVPHFGNWELLNLWVQLQHDLMALYKPGGTPELEDAMLHNRSRFGSVLVPANSRGVRQMISGVRAGQLVAILPDQDPGHGQGRFAPFFGVPALTATLAIRLIQKTECAVMFCACRRAGRGRYQAHFFAAQDDIHSGDVDVALAALNRGVEKVIGLDPAQYLWAYKRFKSRPDKAAPFY